ncbi:N-acetylmuramoyl-L-alanine amidase [Halonatronum saccharophilum]|uniref:N-acetylmuramoyl-L-alanine amidase n=1 Tax=Halonatronum saccharophilum TaxID=150060 RepID=UPI0004BC75C0|nr:N-acetylmuramoyl-L-alanine amidase [Halonatronum saccharophilum]
MKGSRVYFITPLTISLSLIAIFLISFMITYAVNSNEPYSSLDKVVVIDAGHGGIDAGANRDGILEKDINLAIAKELARFLNRGNINVVMTRQEDRLYQDDRNKDIVNRVKIVEDNKADILVSVHVNSFPSSQSFGGQTFYNPGSDEGKKLASAIQEKLIEIQPENYRKIKSAPYYILRKSNVPAVIVEVGFISNPTDVKRMTDPKEQRIIAQGIGEGVINYFNNNLHLLPTEKSVLASREDKSNQIKLYYGGIDGFRESLVEEKLKIESLEISQEDNRSSLEEIAFLSINKLIAGPTEYNSLSLVPKDTQLISLAIEDGIAYVDFSQEFSSHNLGGGSEWLKIKSITKTLTQIEGIDKVQILVEGWPYKTEHFYLDEAL